MGRISSATAASVPAQHVPASIPTDTAQHVSDAFIKIETLVIIYILNILEANNINAMSMKSEIEEILGLLKGLKAEIAKVVKDVKVSHEKQAMMTETIANIHQVSSDLARKFDEVVNVVGVKTPVAAKKPAAAAKGKKEKSPDHDDDGEVDAEVKSPTKSKAAKPKTAAKPQKRHQNIMTFARKKYMEDPSYFNFIMSPDECESLFAEHAEDLASKAGEKKLKAQLGFLYGSISKNKEKMQKLRDRMEKENSEHSNEKKVAAEKDHTDEEEDAASGSE